jgi:hypothetical protein
MLVPSVSYLLSRSASQDGTCGSSVDQARLAGLPVTVRFTGRSDAVDLLMRCHIRSMSLRVGLIMLPVPVAATFGSRSAT